MDAESARHSPLRAWKKQICVAVHGSGLTTLAAGGQAGRVEVGLGRDRHECERKKAYIFEKNEQRTKQNRYRKPQFEIWESLSNAKNKD